MVLNRRISSFIDRGMNFVIPMGIGPFGPGSQNPFSLSRLASRGRGTVIHRLPDERGRKRRVGAIRRIRVPKNFTRPEQVLVISVFSSDRVNFKESKKAAISVRRDLARALVPHTPTSQSSAYLTYSSFEYLGFGRRDRQSLR